MSAIVWPKLHLFLVSGKTFTFTHVAEFGENESYIWFSYVAQSDGDVKQAKFHLAAIAGYTHSEPTHA